MIENANGRILTSSAGFFGMRQCGTIVIAKPLLTKSVSIMKKYMCLICGFIYDEEKGWPDDGIAPGILWANVPLAWICPECGATKDDFEMVEI
jgi:rubredoxin